MDDWASRLFGRFRLLHCWKPIAQRLRGLELDPVAGGDLDFLTGARVAALAGFGPFALEAAQSAYVRLAVGGDRAGDLVDQAIIGRFGRGFRASGRVGDGGDQVALRHHDIPYCLEVSVRRVTVTNDAGRGGGLEPPVGARGLRPLSKWRAALGEGQ